MWKITSWFTSASSKASSSIDHPRDPKAWRSHSPCFDTPKVILQVWYKRHRCASKQPCGTSKPSPCTSNCDLRKNSMKHSVLWLNMSRHVFDMFFLVKKKAHQSSVTIFLQKLSFFTPFWVLKLCREHPAIQPSLFPYRVFDLVGWGFLTRKPSSWMNYQLPVFEPWMVYGTPCHPFTSWKIKVGLLLLSSIVGMMEWTRLWLV